MPLFFFVFAGGFKVKICGWVQYLNLFGVAIGYTIASSISMMWVSNFRFLFYRRIQWHLLSCLVVYGFVWANRFFFWFWYNRAIKRSNCFHASGGKNPCHLNSNPYMIAFGIVEIIFSQIPGFDQLWWLSIVAAVMSFTYSTIGLGLGIAKVAGNNSFLRNFKCVLILR